MLDFLWGLFAFIGVVIGVVFLFGLALDLNYKYLRRKQGPSWMDEHEFGYDVGDDSHHYGDNDCSSYSSGCNDD